MIISEEKVKTAVAAMNDGNVPAAGVGNAACRRIAAMIKAELTAEELAKYSDTIFYAAAVMALRDSLAADTSPADIKLGDMSIKVPQRVEALTAILEENIKFLTPVLEDKTAVFTAVEWGEEPCRT